MKKVTLHIIFILLTLQYFQTKAQVLEQDSLALVAFYNSTGGPNWNNNSNWLTGQVSTWYGVIVENQRVKELKFYSDNNLNGSIPEEIGDLSEMGTFVIGNNPNVTGSLPASIGQLTNMKWFGIGNCAMEGTIPNTVGNCALLVQFNLSQNNLVGTIPPEIGNLDSLVFLNLHSNQLTGPIPPELSNCANLKEIRLNNNLLTESIPPELAQLNNLSVLSLQNNQLTGSIPESFSNFFIWETEDIGLNVSNNNLSGEIPESWASMDFLINILDISNNNFISLPTINNNWLITFIHIENNKLAFEHIESHKQAYNSGLYWFFYYSPQSYLESEIDTALVPGSNYSIYSGTGGEFTNYKWYFNDQLILENPDADTLFLNNIGYSDTGTYTCIANNTLVTWLNLYREPVHITIDTSVYITDKKIFDKNLSCFPNPAKERIAFDYTLPTGETTAIIIITDITGKTVTTLPVKGKHGQEIWDTREIDSGIYLHTLLTESMVKTGAIVIRK